MSQSLLNRGLFPTQKSMRRCRNGSSRSQSLLNRGLFPTERLSAETGVPVGSQSLLNRGLFPTKWELSHLFPIWCSRNPFLIEVFFLPWQGWMVYWSRPRRNPFLIEVFFLLSHSELMCLDRVESQSLLNRGLFPTLLLARVVHSLHSGRNPFLIEVFFLPVSGRERLWCAVAIPS